jgi:hypothetical protein
MQVEEYNSPRKYLSIMTFKLLCYMESSDGGEILN